MLMPEDQDLDSRAKGYRLRRSIMDYGMGMIIFCLGIFFLLAPRLGVAFDIDNNSVIYLQVFVFCMDYSGFTGDIKKTILTNIKRG